MTYVVGGQGLFSQNEVRGETFLSESFETSAEHSQMGQAGEQMGKKGLGG